MFSSAVPSSSGAFQMPTCRPLLVSASTLRRGKKCQSQKCFSDLFGMKLHWNDINNILYETSLE